PAPPAAGKQDPPRRARADYLTAGADNGSRPLRKPPARGIYKVEPRGKPAGANPSTSRRQPAANPPPTRRPAGSTRRRRRGIPHNQARSSPKSADFRKPSGTVGLSRMSSAE